MSASTVINLLQERSGRQPDDTAFTFLVDGEATEQSITYGELDRRARAIASRLRGVLDPGDRALLLYPAGIEFIAGFLGCLYAGVVAVPCPLPRLNRRGSRLGPIASDAQVKLVLTTSELLPKLTPRVLQDVELKNLGCVSTDDVAPSLAQEWRHSGTKPSTIALLQYTSGSTASPRGVMLTHENLLFNSRLISRAFGVGSESMGLIWLPHYHDMGLIGGILQPLYAGIPAVLMSPVHVIQRPVRWLNAMTRFRATVSGGPNFIYDLCARTLSPLECESLDLKDWQVAFNGAEPIRARTVELFVERFGPCGFRREAFLPCYGLAEATLLVSGGPKGRPSPVRHLNAQALEKHRVVPMEEGAEGSKPVVGCGVPATDQEIAIVDPEELTLCEPGRVGEIWVCGPSVARGYWNREKETKEIFRARVTAAPETKEYLRTGDLGFLLDDELWVTGRLKDLIILEGRNHYPQDIELTVESSHSALRPNAVAAFSVDRPVERLVVVCELKRAAIKVADQTEVIEAIRQSIADVHEITVHAVTLVRPGAIPRTSSGKIQRRLCRHRFVRGELESIGDWRSDDPREGAEGARGVTHETAGPGSLAAPESLPEGNAEAIRRWLVARMALQLGCDPREIDVRQPFARYGVSSVDALRIAGELEQELGRRLAPTLIYDFPTIDAVSRHLARPADSAEDATIGPGQSAKSTDPIAIVGVGCRFPGAIGPDEYWRLLANGTDAVTEVPADRWDSVAVDATVGPVGPAGAPGSVRWGGFLDGIDQFDADFFGISLREASYIDPQQRLLMQIVWEALEDAGQVLERLRGSSTGVFVGISTNDYGQLFASRAAAVDPYWATGNASCIAANRISYFFDFRGPSMAVDTACSSSLVAVQQACESLRSGACTLAIAGGVNAILSSDISISFARAGGLSADGRCKAFDSRADGICRSEGVGAVVLKALSRALADGDHIYAVIRGGAVNQDGRSNGITAPNQSSQEAVLREAHRDAGISAADVQYVETHGAGTLLGDVIEANALNSVLSVGRDPARPCALGSVKTNIGHCEAAAGIAGLIKTALALEHRQVPPSLHFVEPNPHIAFDAMPLRVQTALAPWPEHQGRRLAGVSAFGFGGTNAHVVLEAAPEDERGALAAAAAPLEKFLLPLSAASPAALQATAEKLNDSLEDGALSSEELGLADLCHRAAVRRTHLDHRAAIRFDSREELRARLQALRAGASDRSVLTGQVPGDGVPKLAFVFSGHGGQWWGMGRQLMQTVPAFRAKLEECEAALRPHADWSLISEFEVEESRSRLESGSLEVVHTSLFAFQLALVEVWKSWGIRADAVVGHSMGEVAAACAAGALDLEDAVRVILYRSRLLQDALDRAPDDSGMAAIRISAEDAEELIRGKEDRVWIAVNNSPSYTVLSGNMELLRELVASLRSRKIGGRIMKVPGAAHTPELEPLGRELAESLKGLSPRSAAIPFYSTISPVVSPGVDLDEHYWGSTVCKRVGFAPAIDRLLDDGFGFFVEIGPHPILTAAITQCLAHRRKDAVATPSLRRENDDLAVLLESLGSLFVAGREVDWKALYPLRRGWASLPSYPWQSARCWLDSESSDRTSLGQASYPGVQRGHPLLTNGVALADPSGTWCWEAPLTTERFPYLADHRVEGRVLVPATTYLEAALSAASEIFPGEGLVLEDVSFERALFVSDEEEKALQLVVQPTGPGAARFEFFSRKREQPSGPWQSHAFGRVRVAGSQNDVAAFNGSRLEDLRTACAEVVNAAALYERIRERGGDYGDGFRGIEQLWRGEHDAALGRVTLPQSMRTQTNAHCIHPAGLDACLQVMAAALSKDALDDSRLYLPTRVRELRFHVDRKPSAGMWSHVVVRPGEGETVEGDVSVWDEQEQPIVEIRGLEAQPVERTSPGQFPRDSGQWLYQFAWRRDQEVQAPCEASATGTWLLLADRDGLAEAIRRELEQRGGTCITLTRNGVDRELGGGRFALNPKDPGAFRRLLQALPSGAGGHLRGVVQLWSLDFAGDDVTLDGIGLAEDVLCLGTLHLVQALEGTGQKTRLWLVSRGACAVEHSPEMVSLAQAPLWGLGRVIQREITELGCTLVDLDRDQASIDVPALVRQLVDGDTEDQIALRGAVRYLGRLVRDSEAAASSDAGPRRMAATEVPNYRLGYDPSGLLDRLSLREAAREEPGPGEVEIEVLAAGLNFRDVLNALGVRPDNVDFDMPAGLECAGRIVALGEGVTDLHLGDEVLGIAPGCFARFVRTNADVVVRKPSQLSFEEAATIPVAFLTAYYSLHEQARLQPGERVLIHAAAGGVGMAAVRIAQAAGAEVLASAGSPEKRDYLRSLGIQHVVDSRNLSFADDVDRLTNGQGVDVVLNSLAGDAIAKSMSVLRPYGRFVEIGIRDIYENSKLGLRPFERNLSYFAINLARMFLERPVYVGSLLRELTGRIERQELAVLPLKTFSIGEADRAFRYMAQAKHIGKIVVSLKELPGEVELAADQRVALSSEATYLIAGGLGGLGLTVAGWMVERGARHLALVGRSEPSALAREKLAQFETLGVRVLAARADVTDRSDVARIVRQVEESMPPLRGVIHSAAVLQDDLLSQMGAEQFKFVLGPKTRGAWNLHQATLNAPLDFFVCFSSIASLIGSPGQANYAAGNAFLDALAPHRRALGLPALTINWGPWAKVGGAARSGFDQRLTLRGFGSISPKDGTEVLAKLLARNVPAVAVMPVDWRQVRRTFPTAAQAPILKEVLASVALEESPASEILSQLRQAAPESREDMMQNYLRAQIAQTVGGDVERIDVHKPLTGLGIDSLMAMELKNRVEAELNVEIRIAEFLRGPTIVSLTEMLLSQLSDVTPEAAPAEPASRASEDDSATIAAEESRRLLGKLDQLSDDDVDSLLSQILAEQRDA